MVEREVELARKLCCAKGTKPAELEAHKEMEMFTIGARVLIDGQYPAIVRAAFPKGSTSYLFPHYKVDFVAGDKGAAVAWGRVKTR